MTVSRWPLQLRAVADTHSGGGDTAEPGRTVPWWGGLSSPPRTVESRLLAGRRRPSPLSATRPSPAARLAAQDRAPAGSAVPPTRRSSPRARLHRRAMSKDAQPAELERSGSSLELSGLSLEVPDLPLEVPDLPLEVPDLPFQVPDLPLEVPNLPFQVPNLPFQVPNLPFQVPNLPLEVPNLPFQVPNLPLEVPKVPFQVPNLPLELPKVR